MHITLDICIDICLEIKLGKLWVVNLQSKGGTSMYARNIIQLHPHLLIKNRLN